MSGSLPDPVPVYLALLVALDRHQLRRPRKLDRAARKEIIDALDALWNTLDEAQTEVLERRYAAEVQPLFPQPCPPDCEGCALDREIQEDQRTDAALDEARRRGLSSELEPRRALVSESLRLAGKDPGSPPHRADNQGHRPKRGARKPRSKDHRS